MNGVNRCVCCGEIVPEGIMVCPQCEKQAECLHIWLFNGFIRFDGKRCITYKCMRCGKLRIDINTGCRF